jgi:hypothetical protein
MRLESYSVPLLLEYRKVDVQVLKDRQDFDGYWYQEVKINNREHWQIEYEGMRPSRDYTVYELKELTIEVIKMDSYHVVNANCYSTADTLQKHLNPEKLPKPSKSHVLNYILNDVIC